MMDDDVNKSEITKLRQAIAKRPRKGKPFANQSGQLGLTMVEMLITMTLSAILGLIVMMAVGHISEESRVLGGEQNARLEAFMMTEQIRRALWYTGSRGRKLITIPKATGFQLAVYDSPGRPDAAITMETRCQATPKTLRQIVNFGKVGGICKQFTCGRGRRPVISYRRAFKNAPSRKSIIPRSYSKSGSSRDSAVAAAVCFKHRSVGHNIHEAEVWMAYRSRSRNKVTWIRQGVTLPSRPSVSGNVAYLWPGE